MTDTSTLVERVRFAALSRTAVTQQARKDADAALTELAERLEAAERNMRRLADKNVEIQRWADEKIREHLEGSD